ncbi:hypothetical protein AcV5_007675 [Taiwanofungus camphoratus]|nr:hypothetical protein AcW2_007334 [Antrodia cinnamomea]KAI0927030.1 hypothetical protein AcV5_007675 [Antrodia cinnamomea]
MKRSLRIRSKSMQWTDKRIKLIQELLGGMKIIKYFAWEVPFLKRIMYLRQKEIQYIRSLVLTHGASNAIAFSFPVLATVLAFVTYSLTGHNMTSAVIFTSLSLFQLLRTPLQLLPVALSGITDAYNAVNRMYEVFIAETVDETRLTDPSLSVALEVKDAEFTWDGAPPSEDSPKKKRKRKHGRLSVAATRTFTNADVFKLRELNLSVPRGQLCAIVGPVGSGKSSLLQGLMGEMRRTSGTVTFCGSVSYCPQGAWIQNATIRENICFGRPFEPERYWKAVRDVCLLPDFAMLPHGDMTEVGEKGISLSGGQKQRLNICRAIYCDSDIQIFDDPLSALDAHVGKEVFRNVLQSSPQGKTRILVTHALHFLPYTDCIVTVMDGRIAERGTYEELVANANGAFSRWIKEFAIQEGQQDGEDEENGDIVEEVDDEEGLSGGGQCRRAGTAMMQVEERNTGAVGGDVYTTYLKAGNGKIFVPGVLVTLFLYQAANIMSSYWLIYWQEEKWPRSSGFYMGIYAGLGFAQTVIYLLTAGMFAFQAYFASRALHRMAIDRIMHAPMSFFETTPLGRAMNRFSKDTDTLDNYIGDAWSQLMQTVSQVLGAVILISIIFPFFLVPVGVISICYLYYSMFYRASAREFQRLEAILRSSVFSHFSESLTGLVTIRAYGESARFRVINENRIDYENRAYWLTIANQRWLAIRLDMLGALLIFLVALLAVIARFTISPSKTGISLSYILLVQQSFNQIVRLGSTLENEMNSAERIAYYAKHVEQEAPHEIPEHKPPRSWPTHGSIEFNDVHLTYRPGLPPVLKGFNMSVAPGEKVGIVGRTGAGKSSIMVALYRIVELAAGTITIDGIDITKLGLTDLRQAVAIIPQDALLFSGSLRSNLDPFELHDDARLWDALQRSYLVDQPKEGDLTFYPDGNSLGKDTHTPANRFSLDTVIDDDGSNLSVGQRSLISLARALVKDAKLLVLDEATGKEAICVFNFC